MQHKSTSGNQATDDSAVTVTVAQAFIERWHGVTASELSTSQSFVNAREVELQERMGSMHANLVIGANVTKVQRLQANSEISVVGMILVGSGFIVESGDPLLSVEPERIKPYLEWQGLDAALPQCVCNRHVWPERR